MSKDERLYAKFTLDFPDSPKIAPLSAEVKWAFVEMICYSRRMKTDGFLSKPLALARWGASVCLALATNDVEKPSLIESETGWQIHDFGEHQTTSAEIDALSAKRRAAGQKGGKASAQARSKQVLKQKPSKSNPETETETHTELTTDVVSSGPRKRATTRATRLPDKWEPPDDDVRAMREQFPQVDLRHEHEKFCDHWRAKAGKDGVKLDWSATWRNWIRTAAERQGAAGTGRRRSATDRVVSDIDALRDNPRLPHNQRSSLFPVTERTALPPAEGAS